MSGSCFGLPAARGKAKRCPAWPASPPRTRVGSSWPSKTRRNVSKKRRLGHGVQVARVAQVLQAKGHGRPVATVGGGLLVKNTLHKRRGRSCGGFENCRFRMDDGGAGLSSPMFYRILEATARHCYSSHSLQTPTPGFPAPASANGQAASWRHLRARVGRMKSCRPPRSSASFRGGRHPGVDGHPLGGGPLALGGQVHRPPHPGVSGQVVPAVARHLPGRPHAALRGLQTRSCPP